LSPSPIFLQISPLLHGKYAVELTGMINCCVCAAHTEV
jgi:hypothetical protein